MILQRMFIASCVLVMLLTMSTASLRAQQESDPNILFSFDRKEAETQTTAAPLPAPAETNLRIEQTSPTPLPQTIIRHDPAVIPTATTTRAITESPKDVRRLAPLSRADLLPAVPGEKTQTSQLSFQLPQFGSLGTAGAGLVLVVGLFLLCVTLMRRSGPSPMSPLPRDAVAMLGRIPLTPKQFAHLLQVGNKLVLISISGDRTDTITEVTEPAEVERLLTLCMKGNKQSTSVEFQRMLQQMAKEPTRGFLGKEAATYARTARG